MAMGQVKAGTRPPWLGLGAAVWLQSSAGTSSAFALYSSALKVALGADQSGVALLGVACNIGDSFGLLPGVVCNKLHPSLLLLIAAASGFLGYGATWLAVSGIAPALPYWLVSAQIPSLFQALICSGSTWNCSAGFYLVGRILRVVL